MAVMYNGYMKHERAFEGTHSSLDPESQLNLLHKVVLGIKGGNSMSVILGFSVGHNTT